MADQIAYNFIQRRGTSWIRCYCQHSAMYQHKKETESCFFFLLKKCISDAKRVFAIYVRAHETLKLWWWTGGEIWLPNVAIWEPAPNSTIRLPHSSGPQTVPIGGHKPSIVLDARAPPPGLCVQPPPVQPAQQKLPFQNERDLWN